MDGYEPSMSETTSAGPGKPVSQQDNPSPSGDQTADAAEGDTAPTEQSPADGSAATGSVEGDGATGGQKDPSQISDEKLPEDLRPTDDNPLAKPPSDGDEDRGLSLGADGPQAGPPSAG